MLTVISAVLFASCGQSRSAIPTREGPPSPTAVFAGAPLEEIVNLDGAFYLSRLAVPGMKARRCGRIVNTCSFAMKSGGLTAGTAYTTSKGALAALTF